MQRAADNHMDLVRSLQDHRRMGRIDDSVLVVGLIGIAVFALKEGETDAALGVLGTLPEGWEKHVENAPEDIKEVVRWLAQDLLDRGLVSEGVDTSLYGQVTAKSEPS